MNKVLITFNGGTTATAATTKSVREILNQFRLYRWVSLGGLIVSPDNVRLLQVIEEER